MFVLEFFKVVARILDWSEAPGVSILNAHMAHLEMRKPKEVTPLATISDRELSVYIATTYPDYFDLKLRTGRFSTSKCDKISNMALFC